MKPQAAAFAIPHPTLPLQRAIRVSGIGDIPPSVIAQAIDMHYRAVPLGRHILVCTGGATFCAGIGASESDTACSSA